MAEARLALAFRLGMPGLQGAPPLLLDELPDLQTQAPVDAYDTWTEQHLHDQAWQLGAAHRTRRPTRR